MGGGNLLLFMIGCIKTKLGEANGSCYVLVGDGAGSHTVRSRI